MRTVVFIGLISIASAIRAEEYSDDTATILAIIFCASIGMDILEFIKKMFLDKD